MSTKVSILICAYNEETKIARAVKSAIEQNFKPEDFEIIVVNDGSTDGTRKVLGTLLQLFPDRRLRVIDHEKNMGLSAAKNTGIAAALGVYVVYLDANDWFLRDSILILYDILSSNPDASFIWPDYYRVDMNESIIGRTTTAEGSGVMFRKHDIEEVGGFDEALKVFEDKDMYIRLEKAGKKGMHVPCPLYKYEQTPNSLTRGGLSEKETLKCLSAVTKKHYGDNPDEETP